MSVLLTMPENDVIIEREPAHVEDALPGGETLRQLPFESPEFGMCGFFPHADPVAGPDVT